ncbi:hypothetical protein Tco_0476169 [Tanacetum coccineum]
MSERGLSPQPVTQYDPITGEVKKDSEKAAVVKGNYVVSKSKVVAIMSEKSTVVKESVIKSIEKSIVVKESDFTSKVGKSNVSAVVSEKSDVDEKDNPKVSKVSDESNKAAVVAPIIEKVTVATESVKASVAKESVKAPVVAADVLQYKRKTRLSKDKESDKETEPVVVANVKAPIFAAVESVVEKDNPKVTSKVSDESVKAPVVKESVKVPVVKKSLKASSVVADKPSSVVADKVDVVKDNINVVIDKVVKENVLSVVANKASNINVVAVADKASDALKNKPAGKGKKPVVGKDKDKPKNIAPDVVKEKFKPNPKQKVISSEIPVLRLSKQKENPEFKAKVNVKRKMILSKEDDRKKKLKGKSKKDVSDSELETDVVDYSSDEADRKRKKLKIKAGLKRKRSGSDSSDSSELDTKNIKRLISKLEKKVKKQESDEESVPKKGKKKLTKKVEKEESDEESVPKKGKKKLTKKVKKEESDEESVPKKGKKKEKQLTPEEAAHEEYLSSFPSFHARTTPSSLFSAIRNSRVDILGFLTDIGFSSLHNVSIDHLPSKLGWFAVSKFKSYMLSFDSGDKIEVTPSKIHDMLGVPFGGYSLFDLDEREADHEFVRKWAGQFYPLELKKVCVNDIARKLIAAQEIDFLFKVNFLTLFTNTMGKADGLKGQICLDVVRRLREDSVISDIDWCGYIYDCLRDSKLPGGTNHYLGPLTFLILLYLDSTKFDKFLVVRTRPAIRNWSSYLMKQRQELELKDHVLGLLDLHDDWNEAEVQESEAEVQESEGFIGFLETSEKEDLIKKAEEKLSLICAERVMLEDYMRKASLKCPGDGKFVALHEKYVNLFKDPISFKDDGNGDNVGDDDDDENGDDDDGNVDNDANDGDGNGDEEDVNEGDKDPNGSNPSFGFSKISLEDFGNDRGPAEKDKVVEGNQAEECEIMSTPENFTQWLDKNVDLVGEGDKFENVFEAHFGKFIVYGVRLNLETLAPGLWLDPNSKSMFDGTLASFDAKWESFSNQVNAQFKGNKGGLTLGGMDLKKLFAQHLKRYGHIRHTQVARVKQTIPKLKWKTKENFHDCRIFTMLHMETFDGGPASNLDCGLPVESQLQRNMLRRLRFKFAMKILLHEINVHAGKMLELAKEFDKTDPVEKMAIIVDAFKKREERDCI